MTDVTVNTISTVTDVTVNTISTVTDVTVNTKSNVTEKQQSHISYEGFYFFEVNSKYIFSPHEIKIYLVFTPKQFSL